jgi:hypothetical protein
VLDPDRLVVAPAPLWRQRRLVRDLLVLVASVVVAALTWVVAFVRPWDPNMGSAATARALHLKVGGGPFHCRRIENDGSIAGMKDVDYVCESVNLQESGYFVGTSRHRITAVQPTG